MRLSICLSALTLISNFAVAIEPSAGTWAKVEKPDGMGVIFIRGNSSVSVYRIPANDPDIQKFKNRFTDVAVAAPAKKLAPLKCFTLNASKTDSTQTWCDASAKWLVASVEIGDDRMSIDELAQRLQVQISEAKK